MVRSIHATRRRPFERIPLQTSAVSADQLNLNKRQRTNPFPWRGQFSPELVELLISAFGPCSGTVLDSFAGVGTTLWESARLGLDSIGTEINPAAVTMGESVRFLPLTEAERRRVLKKARNLLMSALGKSPCGPLFDMDKSLGPSMIRCSPNTIVETIRSRADELERIVLANVLLRSMCVSSSLSHDAMFREFAAYSDAILGLPHSECVPTLAHADARRAPAADGSIDLVLTSPPYVNVFNYHQNGRKAMEALGWNLLRVARSEFGANRKHRGNRFLTVIQYALDMAEWLTEMRRVLTREGRMIVVIGRESTVRGVAFRNGELLAALAEASGFDLTIRQERRFVTRFGEPILEDILHFRHAPSGQPAGLDTARRIATALLRSAMSPVLAPDVASDLRAAISEAATIRPSPVLQPWRPSCAMR